MAQSQRRRNLALKFYALGFNVLPIGNDKRPLNGYEWGVWKTTRQTPDDIAAMDWQHASGIALIYGSVSGDHVCIDFDKQDDRRAVDTFLAMADLSPDYPWQVETPGGGWHVIIRCPGLTLPNGVGKLDRAGILGGHIETRFNGHYALSPASLHPSGGKYTLIGDPAELPVEPPVEVDPAALLDAYAAVTIEPEKLAAPPDDRPYDQTDRDYTGYIRAALDGEYQTVASTGKGKRNKALYDAAMKLGGFVKEGLLTEGDLFRTLEAAAAINGLVAGDGSEAVRKTIASGLKNADPRRPRARFNRVKSDPQGSKNQTDNLILCDSSVGPVVTSGPKVTLKLPYISDMDLSLFDPGGAFILKDRMGGGKTAAFNRIIAHVEGILGRVPRVVVINSRCALSSSLSERTNIEDYQSVPRDSRPIMHSLVITANQLVIYKELPDYDIVIIDESEETLPHITGGTLSDNQGNLALSALEHIVSKAKWVICADAHAGALTFGWLKSIRRDLKFIENIYQPEKKLLNRFSSDTAMLAHLDQALDSADAPILVACASKSKAEKVYQHFVNRGIAPAEIKLITSEESADEHDFIRHINDRLPAYKLLIVTPAMGSGVSIDIRIYAAYGFFTDRHRDFIAPAMLQMMGRARHAESYHFELNASPLEEPRPTLHTTIYKAELDRMINGNERVEQFFNEQGLKDISPRQKRYLRLLSRVEARRNVSKNDLLKDFIRLADRQYAITENDAPPVAALREELSEIGRQQKEAEKVRLLTAIPITQDEYAEKSKEATGPELDALKAGLDRGHIEDYYKQTLTEQIYDFNEANGQQRLNTFVDLLTSTKFVASEAREEIRDDFDGNKRTYRPHKRQLIVDAIKAVWGEFNPRKIGALNRNAVSEAAITEGIATFLETHEKDFKRYFKRRSARSDDPVDLLRWILKRAGLQLDLVRNCKLADEGTFYRVSNGSLSQMEGLAAARLKGLEKDDSTRFGINISIEKSKSRRARVAA